MSLWIAVFTIGAGTFAIRASFLFLYERLELSPTAERALELVPAAVLSALVAPSVLAPEGSVTAVDPRVGAALAALGAAWYREDILSPIVVGLLVLVGLRTLAG